MENMEKLCPIGFVYLLCCYKYAHHVTAPSANACNVVSLFSRHIYMIPFFELIFTCFPTYIWLQSFFKSLENIKIYKETKWLAVS